MKTLLLDRTAWDLVLDANGDIAVAADPYALAQDVASAIRTFLGEQWYDKKQGMPYWQSILGKQPPVALVKAQVEQVARTVEGVASAQAIIVSTAGRTIFGQVQVTDTAGNLNTVNF